jgi:hypothetical protein
MDDALENLYPLIVPAEYVQSGVWNLPHSLLKATDLILTWVVLHEGQGMVYVTADQVAQWQRGGIKWSAVALENMRRDTGNNPATHKKRDENANLQWVAMMQPDGLGSSRVLMTDELEKLFPNGYSLAIPERSVGMALSASATPQYEASFREVVRNCHRNGTTPMVSRLLGRTELDSSTLG